MRTQQKGTTCKARTKVGKPCRAAAMEGGFCFFHANPNKAAELGRIGGRKNRHFVAGGLEPLPKIETAKEVLQMVARLIADVHSGTLHPRIAAGLAPLLSLQLRAIQITDEVERIAKLESSMANLQTPDPAVGQK